MKKTLSGPLAWLGLLFCSLPLLFGFVIPSVQLFSWVLQTYQHSIDADFLLLVSHSVELAIITSLIAGMLAVLIAYTKRIHLTVVTRAMTRVLGMGYAIPGTVIAVGVLLPFTWFDTKMSLLLDRDLRA